ncbi:MULTISPECIES: hypothetical protein [Streptomyces]|uniref:Uncharacterized protein n=1 Tax=Streptomyces venezuelae TaxID=54571 RepID=A0A5P2B037_STRVZ|nr:hypothetical protein [Streptomyces venezuelae]QES23854.1 hypothetical protein DEJ46_35985 [Streptomyces venezuelae]
MAADSLVLDYVINVAVAVTAGVAVLVIITVLPRPAARGAGRAEVAVGALLGVMLIGLSALTVGLAVVSAALPVSPA